MKNILLTCVLVLSAGHVYSVGKNPEPVDPNAKQEIGSEIFSIPFSWANSKDEFVVICSIANPRQPRDLAVAYIFNQEAYRNQIEELKSAQYSAQLWKYTAGVSIALNAILIAAISSKA